MANTPPVPPINYPDTLTPFRFFCQRVLPAVYSDELSYYELLCKVVGYLNTTMENVNILNDDMQELNKYIVELQKYIDTYFDNLDVQDEINKKLDSMVADGTMSALIKPIVDEYVNGMFQHYEEIESKLDSLLAKYGTPLVFDGDLNGINESTTVDKTRVYVLTSNGHWVYYNGTAWVDGGTYNSQGIGDNEVTPEMLNSTIYRYLDEWEWTNVIDWDNASVNRNDFNTFINKTPDGMTVKAVDTSPSDIYYRAVFPKVYPRGTVIEGTYNYLTPGAPEKPLFGICEPGTPANTDGTGLLEALYVRDDKMRFTLQVNEGGSDVANHALNTWQNMSGMQTDLKFKIYVDLDGVVWFCANNWWVDPAHPEGWIIKDVSGNRVYPEEFCLYMQIHAAVTNHGFKNVRAYYVGSDWGKVIQPGEGAVFTAPMLGNNRIAVQLPTTYTRDSNRGRFPMVMLAHGNGFSFDGRPYNTGFTHITQYMPTSISDNPPDYWIMTDDWTKWYKTQTSEALLDAGYVCVSSTYFADNLYGNEDCINAFGALYDYVVNHFNVVEFCFALGASNGCMTVLNGLNLLEEKVRAVAMLYPLCCLYNQYQANTNHQAPIREAYDIPAGTPVEDIPNYLWQHDPLTSYVIDGKKAMVYPAFWISYSNQDTTTKATANAIPFIDMLNASQVNSITHLATGAHGDVSHFDPAATVEFFNSHRGV